MRSLISSAAAVVKVIQTILDGSSFFERRYCKQPTRQAVFPLAAQLSTRTFVSVVSTIAFCKLFKAIVVSILNSPLNHCLY